MEVDGVSMCLQRVIQGDLLDIDDPDQVQAPARSWPGFTTHWRHTPTPIGCRRRGGSAEPLAARVTDWLDSRGEHVPAAARDALRQLVTDAPPDRLQTGSSSRRFPLRERLVRRREVAAVIDFEEARIDHRTVEVARSAVMLGTRFRDWGPVSARGPRDVPIGLPVRASVDAGRGELVDVLVLWQAFESCHPAMTRPGGGHRHSATWKNFATDCELPAHEVDGLAAGSAVPNPKLSTTATRSRSCMTRSTQRSSSRKPIPYGTRRRFSGCGVRRWICGG